MPFSLWRSLRPIIAILGLLSGGNVALAAGANITAGICEAWLIQPEAGSHSTLILGTKPRFETERLWLRTLDPRTDSGREVAHFILDMPPDHLFALSRRVDPVDVVAELVSKWSTGVRIWPDASQQILYVELLMFHKSSGALMGRVGVSEYENLRIEIGYAVRSDHQGMGYATEAVGAVMREIERQTGPRTFYAWTHKENVRSLRVMEKLGFGEWVTEGETVFRLRETPHDPQILISED